MSKQKLILAYSGGLDTSVAIKWLSKDYDVIALCMDVGEGKDLSVIKEKALLVGAIESIVLDVKEKFAQDFDLPALQYGAHYENAYPVISALTRPLIAEKLVEVAHEYGATAVAHVCTGNGNDQVRFEVSVAALDPSLEVIAPVREWKWSRNEEIAYAKENNVPIPINLGSPYSIDINLWGRTNECGVLENPRTEPPQDADALTVAPEDVPDQAEVVIIGFEAGVPFSINGTTYPLAKLITELNIIAGAHGVGRIDHVENRLVGIKSREVYECPGATVLLKAHAALETIKLTRDFTHFKPLLSKQYAETIYNGLFHAPLTKGL
jgi:argininosuccinate synthase